MELKVATIFDALRDGTIDAKTTLFSFFHRLFPQRYCEAASSVVPGFLLVHIRVEGGLIKVDHWPAFHDPVRHSHSKFYALSLQLQWVFAVRVELCIRWRLFNSIPKVEQSQFLPRDIYIVEFLNLYHSLSKGEVHPVIEARAAQ